MVGAVAQAGATPGGASYQSVYDAMIATGNRLLTAADDAAKAKRKVTARDRYLRAAQYYNQALFWVLGTSTPDAEESVYRAMDDGVDRSGEAPGARVGAARDPVSPWQAAGVVPARAGGHRAASDAHHEQRE